MNSTAYHLTIFLACLLAFVVLTVTNHLPSQLVQGVIYGVLGLSGTNSASAIVKFFIGPDAPVGLSGSGKQGGFISQRLCAVLFFVAFAGFLGAYITGCAIAGTTPAQDIAATCAAGSASVKVLTQAEAAGYLSAAESTKVEQALAVVTPLCTGPTPPNPSQAEAAALAGAMVTLTTISSKYHATQAGP